MFVKHWPAWLCGVLLALAAPGAAQEALPGAAAASDAFIRNWLVCGPFPNPTAPGVNEYRHDETTLGFYADYLKPVGGETGVQPEAGQTFRSVDAMEYTWRRYESPSDYLDFCDVYEDNQDGKVAYAACYLDAATAREAVLSLGSNDGVRAWLNGRPVWTNHRPRGAGPDDDFAPVRLAEGRNLLLVKVDQGWGGWGLYARVLARDQALAMLETAPAPELEVKQALREDAPQLTVWMGAASRFQILEPPPLYRAALKTPEGDVLQTRNGGLGRGVVFNLEPLETGPYWLDCQTRLPTGDTVAAKAFYHHGESPVRVRTYNEAGQPAALDVELLDADWQVVEEGVQQVEAGETAVLRTDAAPFHLRVLLDGPALGRRWYRTGGPGFRVPEEGTRAIDILRECALAEARRVRAVSRRPDVPQWIRDQAATRLSRANPETDNPYQVLRALSSLKAAVVKNARVAVWYAPSFEKVARTETIPQTSMPEAPLSLARNEYEAFQLVLSAPAALGGVQVVAGNLVSDAGAVLSARHIEIRRAEYVDIEMTTDDYGTLGPWPDPLPRLRTPLTLEPGINTPLWITVYAPPEQAPGVYRGAVRLREDGTDIVSVPVRVRVWDITLPAETHTETAYGVHMAYDWWGPLDEAQRQQVFDLTMQLCARHRVSPYRPHARTPIRATFEGDPARPVLDFAAFDTAMRRYLEQFRFNSFRMGGLPGELNGHKRYSDEYNRLFKATYRQVQEHLRERGWLDKAYWYWVDEPALGEYAAVKRGMELLREACPDMRRLLTCNQEQAPIPYFHGLVNVWVPIMNHYSPERAAARQDLGETVWWYVCTGPKAPYPNNFIDHPAINHRIRFWQLDRFGLDGSLYWAVTSWRQNPWKQAMAINPSGGPWGNGDGRLLYPPRREPAETPVLEPPVTSIRFESLRDGLEDREYLIQLRRVAAGHRTEGRAARAAVAAAHRELAPAMTCFEQSPLLFGAMRARVAAALASGE